MSQSSLITPTIVLITGHFSNSTEMLKFCGKGQIPRLSSKFYGPRKTVGPNHKKRLLLQFASANSINT